MLLLDTNAIPYTFDSSNGKHVDFVPVRDFILVRRGRFALGGSKYLAELKKLSRYAELIAQLEKRGQVERVASSIVDSEERRIRELDCSTDFDDPHLIALVIVANVVVLVTADKRCDKFIKDRKFYPKGSARPSIYREIRHRKLLDRLPCASA